MVLAAPSSRYVWTVVCQRIATWSLTNFTIQTSKYMSFLQLVMGDTCPIRYRFILIMKITVFITLALVLQATAETKAQKITLTARGMTLQEVMNTIQHQQGYSFFFLGDQIAQTRIDAEVKQADLVDAMAVILAKKNLDWYVEDRTIIITRSNRQQSRTNPTVSEPQTFAQNAVVGRVTDGEGRPLDGVTVRVKGTSVATTTDTNGQYTLTIPEGGTVISYSIVGFEAVEQTIDSRMRIDVSLQATVSDLNEVVVIGYGTMKRSDLTGSVTDISAEKLGDQPVTSIDQQLVGRIAGVQIQQGSGAPGVGTSIRIRGAGSLGAGNEPLYVIDGMPYSSSTNFDLNPLSFINPADIENISVLKDASSTAIYGSRGANGVILITTRNAGKETDEINISAYVGVNQIPQRGRPEMMNAQDFAIYQRDRIAAGVRQRLNREPVESDYPVIYQNVENIGEGTNWYDLILRDAVVQNYTVDLQKSMDRSRFYLGFGYYDQDGVVYNSGFKRFSTNFNYTYKFNDKIQIDASLRPSYVDQDRIASGGSRSEAMSIALWAPPNMDAYDEMGNLIPFIQMPANVYASNPWSFPNPLFMLEETSSRYNELRNLGNVAFQWDIIPGLRFRTALSTIYNTTNNNVFVPSTVGSPNAAPRDGSATAGRVRAGSFNWLVENTLNYQQAFGNHVVSGLLGYTTQKSRARSLNLNAGPFANDLIETINAAPGITSWGESINEWSMISYLGRVNYTYNDRYLFTATLRSDGSSRFGTNNRFALFPSAAVAWRVSEEDFLKDVSAIDQLKLRASYGRSGNNNIGNYSHLSSVNATQYVFNNKTVSAATISLSNPDLGWEESEQIDAGLDLNLLNNRISFTADLYRRRSVRMLLNDYIPTITGFSTQLVNKGTVENKGVELAIDAIPFQGAFTWNLGFNIAFNRNKIIATNENNDPILSGSVDGRASNYSEVGKPIGMFYGFILDGVYSQADIDNPEVPKYPGATAGWPKYRDLDGDGSVTEILDYTTLGSPHPAFTFGFSSTMTYRDVDFSIALNGRQGGYIMNGVRQTTDNLQGLFNIGKEWVNRWRGPDNPGDGMHAAGPQIVHRVNTLWLEDASYLRVTNLSLGYTLPTGLFSGTTTFKRFRVYVSAQNLLTLTDYKGANPEGQASNVDDTLSPGFDFNAYPIPRIITAGLNVKF
ncbi:TonB-linked outer membrane protein, SusC/RagA family [Parapedobacter indicus]|uniref:TonB-linked outer membrane protein, SusC/RagA family n=2 Tax=Parapedobacter indicus TaxID=1477437 RepID=A0A1I3FYX5_9SPHI|nr:TonB-linked SusC/RagA family outer membrane protein [Parapedobacter indicus]SFI16367.1 TonB-linked outer membrane protein, SusC/RagA family [Parapedobacter indicus]